MTIEINNTYVEVQADFQIVYDRLKQYQVSDKECVNKLIILNNYILISINEYKLEIKKEVITTDIYPIINNIIGYLVNDDNNLYIHSVLISKNNEGLLILGDFQSGKSTLSHIASQYGYEINSADQTWIKNNELVLGSYINKRNGEYHNLSNKCTTKKIFIKKILIIKGLCNNGDVSIIEQTNPVYNIKNIYKYASWHYDMPLLTDNVLLNNQRNNILSYLSKMNLPVYFIRGDARKIVEQLDGRE